MPVEIKKQYRAPVGVRTEIKLAAQQVVNLRDVGISGKQFTGVADKVVRALFNDIEQIDEITVYVSEDVAVVIRIEEHRAGADKRLYQAIARRQVSADSLNQRVLAACPFQKRAVLLHAFATYSHSSEPRIVPCLP
ncbi:hypothetical protein SODG_003526 [Sodalis praecaptivus]